MPNAMVKPGDKYAWQKFFENLKMAPNDSVVLTRVELKKYIDELLESDPDDFREFTEALIDRVFADEK